MRIESMFSKFDIFGSVVTLNFQRSSIYKTSVGGFISLIFIAFISIFFWSNIMSFFRKENVHTSTSKIYRDDPPPSHFDSTNFMFAVKINQDYFIEKPFFNITFEMREFVTYTNGTKERIYHPFPLERCTLDHWKDLPSYGKNWTDQYYQYDFNNYLCPRKDSKFILSGRYNSNSFYHWKFSIKKCKNDYPSDSLWKPTCATDKEINDYFSNSSNIRFLLYLNNFILDPIQSDKYVETFVEDTLFFSIQRDGAYQTADIYLTESIVQTDNSIVPFTDIQEDKFMLFQTSNFRNQYVVGGDMNVSYADFFILKDPYAYIIQRQYQKITEILSYIGGFAQIFILVTAIIVKNYNSYEQAISLANKIYDFQVQDERKQNFKQNQQLIKQFDSTSTTPINNNQRSSFAVSKLQCEEISKIDPIMYPIRQNSYSKQAARKIDQKREREERDTEILQSTTRQLRSNDQNQSNNYPNQSNNYQNQSNNCQNQSNSDQNQFIKQFKTRQQNDTTISSKLELIPQQTKTDLKYIYDGNQQLNDLPSCQLRKQLKLTVLKTFLSNYFQLNILDKCNENYQNAIIRTEEEVDNDDVVIIPSFLNIIPQKQKAKNKDQQRIKKEQLSESVEPETPKDKKQKIFEDEKQKQQQPNDDKTKINLKIPLQRDEEKEIASLKKSNIYIGLKQQQLQLQQQQSNIHEQSNESPQSKYQLKNQQEQFLSNQFEYLLKRDDSLHVGYRYFLYKLSCGKLFSNNQTKLIDKTVQQMKMDLDIFMIINKLKEIEKLKCLLLDQNQEILFNFFPKPIISIQEAEENLTRAEIVNNFKRNNSQPSLNSSRTIVNQKQQKKLNISLKAVSVVSDAISKFKAPIRKKPQQFDNITAYRKLYSAYINVNQREGQSHINNQLIQLLGNEMNQIFRISNLISKQERKPVKKLHHTKESIKQLNSHTQTAEQENRTDNITLVEKIFNLNAELQQNEKKLALNGKQDIELFKTSQKSNQYQDNVFYNNNNISNYENTPKHQIFKTNN